MAFDEPQDAGGMPGRWFLNVSKTLITTEKDAVKLCEFKDMFSDYSVYYVPIEIEFLHNRELSKYI